MKGQLRIDSMFAFVVVDRDGTEGIPAYLGDTGVWLPMVGADMEKVDELRPMARLVAQQLGKPIELVRFTRRQTVEWIEP